MARARFVAPARREVLADVVYYQRIQAELRAKFLSAVEDATALALAYPMTGSPAANKA